MPPAGRCRALTSGRSWVAPALEHAARIVAGLLALALLRDVLGEERPHDLLDGGRSLPLLFALDDLLRAGLGADAKLGWGVDSLMFNATTEGQDPTYGRVLPTGSRSTMALVARYSSPHLCGASHRRG